MASRDASADALADRELGQARGVTSHAIGLDATTSDVIAAPLILTREPAVATTREARPSTD